MSGSWLTLIEVSFVFLVAFGWGLNELRQLRRHRDEETRRDGAVDGERSERTVSRSGSP